MSLQPPTPQVSAAAMNEILPITNSATPLSFLLLVFVPKRHVSPSSSALVETSMPSASSVGFVLVFIASMETVPLVTFQDEALVDSIDRHGEDRRSPTVNVTDGCEEAESDCDEGSNYDAEDDDDWVCAPRYSKNRNTTSYLFSQDLLEILSEWLS
jgi:hypothetical protein